MSKDLSSKKKTKELLKILHLIQQAGVLMQMKRSHQRHLGNAFDTVASHTFQTTVVAYSLARMEGLTHDEAQRCIAMATFHDLVEARTTDLDYVAKQYVEEDEEKAIDDQFKNIAFGDDLKSLIKEYEERKTLAAKCARDADSLTQMYTEWVLAWQGNKLAQKWFDSDFNDRVPGFKTESARKLAFLMKDSNPNEWWWSEFLEDDAVTDTEKLLGTGE